MYEHTETRKICERAQEIALLLKDSALSPALELPALIQLLICAAAPRILTQETYDRAMLSIMKSIGDLHQAANDPERN
jgi:hypothetical protein